MPRKPKKDPYNKVFEFPEALCNQINECSQFGFVLFYIDGNGNPDVRLNFLNGMAEGAIRDYGARFFNSINQSLDIQEVQSFLDINPPQPPPNNSEDFKDNDEEDS